MYIYIYIYTHILQIHNVHIVLIDNGNAHAARVGLRALGARCRPLSFDSRGGLRGENIR